MTTLKKTMLSNTILDRFALLLIDTVINQFFRRIVNLFWDEKTVRIF